MKNENLFKYPNNLQIIFDKLEKNNIKPIIVGGYIRDFFLNTISKQENSSEECFFSKDVDIELYGVNSFEELENILKEFGDVNNVGKSFGVCKLSLENIEIDFTLPRTDNKISSGHSGFSIKVEKNLDFKSATSRRDFTINAIGYDITNNKILDPFYGLDDIENKILRAVDIEKFSEDPLRVFRLVGFSSRLNFTIERELFLLCKDMCDNDVLKELPKERIMDEVKKILLKSPSPSIGFLLLKDLNALQYLQPLNKLNDNDFSEILKALDKITKILTVNNKTNITLMLAILCYKFNKFQTEEFISNLTGEKKLLKDIYSLTQNTFKNSYNDSELLLLATKVNIEYFLIFSQAIHDSIDNKIFQNIKSRACELNILNKKEEPLLRGRDILEYGIKPSDEYSVILSKAYEAQINLEIRDKKEAKKWLKDYLLT